MSGRPTAAIAGAALGLGLAPFAPAGSPPPAALVCLAAVLALALVAAPRPGGPALALAVACGAAAGLGVGQARVAAIDAGALTGRAGAEAEVRGWVLATPHRSQGTVSVRVGTPDGRVMIQAPEPVADLPAGREVVARGSLRDPAPWESGFLARLGIAQVLRASRIEPTGARRGGFQGAIDGIRDRASSTLGSGTAAPEAQLLRGFVLGEDDRIDQGTVSDFRRSGLAHLLAVSGENVALLGLLAAPILGLLGVPLRRRLAVLLALIAVYVLVTGASPSIERAGVSGAATVIATLAGRPASRRHVVALAAVVTLALNPRATGDPGWQLSFAAVVGIILAAAPIRDALLPAHRPAGRVRRALAEGAGVTVAATLATAPLVAASFGNASLTALPANLLALPAVAPVMWLGMLAAALAQVPALPVAPLVWFAGLLAAYVAQVAHWLGSPGWAQVGVPSMPAAAVAALYAAICAGLYAALTSHRRRRSLRVGRGALAAAAVACAALTALALGPGRSPSAGLRAGLRVTVLDVGQGDSILLDPRRGAPILVDGGPPGDDLAGKLRAAGVAGVGAALVTHDQADHAGGVEDLLGSMPVARFGYGVRSPRLLARARATGVRPLRLAQGSELRSGALRLDILWPPAGRERGAAARAADPNTLALVGVARWHGFSMLLTADAEAEQVPVDPGPVDVLKVAHHGSADAGLPSLLARTSPRFAVISVGAGNRYGHPDPATLRDLAEAHVPVARTDVDGQIEIDVTRHGWSAHAGA